MAFTLGSIVSALSAAGTAPSAIVSAVSGLFSGWKHSANTYLTQVGSVAGDPAAVSALVTKVKELPDVPAAVVSAFELLVAPAGAPAMTAAGVFALIPSVEAVINQN
jgi:hypothetical protein